MTLNAFLEKIRNNEVVNFADTMNVIAENYTYQATEFSNGELINAAGTNEGSCKLFAFASLHQLNEAQTLNLFGEHYRDVLNDPTGSAHQNIRNFMRSGWQGILFSSTVLTAK